MRCTKCGHTLSTDAEHCPSCGAPVPSHPAADAEPAPLSADILNAALLEAVGSILQNADTTDDTAAQADIPAEEVPAPTAAQETADEPDFVLPDPVQDAPVDSAETAAAAAEPAFILPDPKQDALADSIEAAVAAAISTLTAPADTAAPQGAPAPDPVPDDTAPLPLPEEVTAAIPEPAPLASAKPAEEAPHPSSDQAPEDDTMKASPKKRRRQKHPFRFIYTLPTLLVAVVLLVGAILFAVKSLLTPIEMPKKPAQQKEDIQNESTDSNEDDSAVVVDGIPFEFL